MTATAFDNYAECIAGQEKNQTLSDNGKTVMSDCSYAADTKKEDKSN